MRTWACILLGVCLQANASDCKWIWGDGKRLKVESSFCQLEFGTGPSLIRIPLPGKFTSNKILSFDFYLDNPSQIPSLEFRIGKGEDWKKYRSTSLSFFQDPQFNFVKAHQWNPVTFSLTHFQEGNLQVKGYDTLFLYLDNPKKAPVSVKIKNLDFKEKIRKVGWVSITVDDGYESVFTAAEKMKKYGLKGTAYLIEKGIGRPGSLASKQACQMAGWGWALGYHHETPFTELANLQKVFESGKSWLKSICEHTHPDHVAYPLGKQTHEIRDLAGSHFKSGRLASGGLETLPPAHRMALRVFNVLSSTTPEEILLQAEKAVRNGDWFILMFHHFKDSPKTDLDYSWKDFEAVIKGLQPYSSSVKTVPEVFEALN